MQHCSGVGDSLLYGVGVEWSAAPRRLRQNSATVGNTRQQVRRHVSTVDDRRTQRTTHRRQPHRLHDNSRER